MPASRSSSSARTSLPAIAIGRWARLAHNITWAGPIALGLDPCRDLHLSRWEWVVVVYVGVWEVALELVRGGHRVAATDAADVVELASVGAGQRADQQRLPPPVVRACEGGLGGWLGWGGGGGRLRMWNVSLRYG
jgi:hypothetical protein